MGKKVLAMLFKAEMSFLSDYRMPLERVSNKALADIQQTAY